MPSPNTWTYLTPLIPNFRPELSSHRGTHWTPPCPITRSMLNELGIPIQFAHPENHQANPVERFHQTLYAFVKSPRQEGETCLISGIRTAVMLYNASIHTSLG